MIISLASRIIRVDCSTDAAPAREQYYHSSRPVFLLLSIVPLSLVVLSIVSTLGDSVPNRPDLIKLNAMRLTTFIGMLYLAWSRKALVHWVGIGALFLVTLSLSARLTVRAIGGDI